MKFYKLCCCNIFIISHRSPSRSRSVSPAASSCSGASAPPLSTSVPPAVITTTAAVDRLPSTGNSHRHHQHTFNTGKSFSEIFGANSPTNVADDGCFVGAGDDSSTYDVWRESGGSRLSEEHGTARLNNNNWTSPQHGNRLQSPFNKFVPRKLIIY